MAKRKPKDRRLVIIGLGGIGQFVARVVPQILAGQGDNWSLLFVDGDKYDQSNFPRQCLSDDVGEFKSVCWMRRFFGTFSNVHCGYFQGYVNEKSQLLFSGDLVLLCVDNHKTRKIVSDLAEALENAILISAGNELYDGNVQVFIRRDGANVTPALGAYHPEIANPSDRAPFEKSCEELATHEPQIVAANLAAASVMINALYNELTGVDNCAETYFDVSQNCSTGRTRR